MKANALCVAVLHAIVKLFVVAEVETAMLELPLQVPVSLGDEQEAGKTALDGRDHVNPVFRFGPRPGTRAPGSFKDRIQHEHRHVTANAIALLGDAGKGLN